MRYRCLNFNGDNFNTRFFPAALHVQYSLHLISIFSAHARLSVCWCCDSISTHTVSSDVTTWPAPRYYRWDGIRKLYRGSL